MVSSRGARNPHVPEPTFRLLRSGLLILHPQKRTFRGALQNPEAIQQVHVVALYVALDALVAKELWLRYMLKVAKRVKSSMLVAAFT